MSRFELSEKYFIKTSEDGQFEDITTLVNGVRILAVDGMLERGKPVNIYTAQWVNSQTEDFLIAGDTVIRENVDITVTFIVSEKYADRNTTIDTTTQYDEFLDIMTNSDIWIKSAYTDKTVHCVCLEKTSLTTTKLKRNGVSYLTGTITLHTLGSPTTND